MGAPRIAILSEDVGPLLRALDDIGEVVHCPLTQTVSLLTGQHAAFVWLSNAPGHALFTLTARRTITALESRFRSIPAACIGSTTAAAAREAGYDVALSAIGSSESLAEAIIANYPPGTRVLLPGSSRTRDILAEKLKGAGMETMHLYLYTARPHAGAEASIERARTASVVVATSPHQVKVWSELTPAPHTTPLWVALNEPTLEACEAAGFEGVTMPSTPTDIAHHIVTALKQRND